MTGYKDLSPRGGVTYDVFGNGKTAVKVNFGKYLEPTSNNNNYILSNPITRIATTASRSWTDSNNNFVADCNLRDPLAQNLATSGGDICGQMNNLTFGTPTPTTAAIDPKILQGGACARTTGRLAPRSSSRSCRGCQSKRAISAAG